MKKLAFLFIAFFAMHSCQSDLDTAVEESSALRSGSAEKPQVEITWRITNAGIYGLNFHFEISHLTGTTFSLEDIKHYATGILTDKGYIYLDSWYPEMPYPEPPIPWEFEMYGNDASMYVLDLYVNTNQKLQYRKHIVVPSFIMGDLEWAQLAGSDFTAGVIGWGCGYQLSIESDKQIYECIMDTTRIYF